MISVAVFNAAYQLITRTTHPSAKVNAIVIIILNTVMIIGEYVL